MEGFTMGTGIRTIYTSHPRHPRQRKQADINQMVNPWFLRVHLWTGGSYYQGRSLHTSSTLDYGHDFRISRTTVLLVQHLAVQSFLGRRNTD